MLPLALSAWSGALRAARALPVLFALSAALLCAVSLAAIPTLAQSSSDVRWALALIAQAAAMAWSQAVLIRLVLRHLMIGDDGGLAALRINTTLPQVAGAVLLTQIMAAAPLALLAATLIFLLGEIGSVSTWLSVPLLLPLVLLAMACALRLGPAAAPASLALSAPLADSWAITEGHVAFMAGASVIALGPILIAIAAIGPELSPTAWAAIPAALGLTASWLALSTVHAGLVVGFYQRWQTLLRPDMRPSRNRARRHDPVLGG